MATENSSSYSRSRNWTFILYTENAKDDWRTIVQSQYAKWIISPLHDLDVQEHTGEIKLPHYHIILTFESKKSLSQISKIISYINALPPEPVKNMKGLVRYMAHLDNPEKYQYNPKKITSNNKNLSVWIGKYDRKQKVILEELSAFIYDNEIYNYMQLHEIVSNPDNDFPPDWKDVLYDRIAIHAVHSIIKANRYHCSR